MDSLEVKDRQEKSRSQGNSIYQPPSDKVSTMVSIQTTGQSVLKQRFQISKNQLLPEKGKSAWQLQNWWIISTKSVAGTFNGRFNGELGELFVCSCSKNVGRQNTFLNYPHSALVKHFINMSHKIRFDQVKKTATSL